MNRSCILSTIVFVFAVMAPGASAQIPVPPDADINVQLFLRSFYPELFQRSVTLVWHAEGRQRQVSVMEGGVDPLKGGDPTPLMEANFELDSNDGIRAFSARGAYLNEEDNRRLASETKGTVESSAAAASIGRAPAFGPERPPPLPGKIDLARGSGGQLRPIASARATGVAGNYGFLWSVTAEIGDTAKTYVLMFEPFDGRLVSMVER